MTWHFDELTEDLLDAWDDVASVRAIYVPKDQSATNAIEVSAVMLSSRDALPLDYHVTADQVILLVPKSKFNIGTEDLPIYVTLTPHRDGTGGDALRVELDDGNVETWQLVEYEENRRLQLYRMTFERNVRVGGTSAVR